MSSMLIPACSPARASVSMSKSSRELLFMPSLLEVSFSYQTNKINANAFSAAFQKPL
jgi:hypothetical protein